MESFYSIYAQGLARIAACTLPVHPAQPLANAAAILEVASQCSDDGVALAAFPELSLTGYNVDDLFLQDVLLSQTLEAIEGVASAEVSHEKGTAVVTLTAPVSDDVLKTAVEAQDYTVKGIQ